MVFRGVASRHFKISNRFYNWMTRVAAIAKDHSYLAAVEGYLADRTSTDRERSVGEEVANF